MRVTIVFKLLLVATLFITPVFCISSEFTQFIPMNDKIADINHADNLQHTLTLTQLGLPNNTVAINIGAGRASGSGNMLFYPNDDNSTSALAIFQNTQVNVRDTHVYAVANSVIRYRQTVADDDWDLYCYGYFISVEETPSTNTTTYTNGGSYILMVAVVLIVLVVAGGMRKR